MPQKVLVTGAGGKTGSIVLKKLSSRPGFEPVGLVRTQQSAKKLLKALKGLTKDQPRLQVGSINQPEVLEQAMLGVDAVVLCTSAVPKIKLLSLLPVLFNFLRKLLGMAPARPQFKFGGGGEPEQVDYIGAKAQIDAAKRAGVKKFVFVSSMGGTQPNNFLNTIGKRSDGTGGDILLWKRKAEEYLIASGLDYTILHPGGLKDTAGGQRELVADVDDKLLSGAHRSIPREDVAEVCVQALTLKEASKRSIDLVSKPEGEGIVTTDFAGLFKRVKGNCDYSLRAAAATPLQ